MTLSCQRDDGQIIARAWRWPADDPVRGRRRRKLALETANAREPCCSPTVPLKDAVANLQRALLLVRALETGRPTSDLREALRDRWHQPARGPLVPVLAEALALEHPAVLGVCLSGAGPSIVALAAPGRADEAADALAGVYRRLDVPHTIRTLAAHQPAIDRPQAAAA